VHGLDSVATIEWIRNVHEAEAFFLSTSDRSGQVLAQETIVQIEEIESATMPTLVAFFCVNSDRIC
jgi:hypothetical protein